MAACGGIPAFASGPHLLWCRPILRILREQEIAGYWRCRGVMSRGPRNTADGCGVLSLADDGRMHRAPGRAWVSIGRR
jgi:hypothetical protein